MDSRGHIHMLDDAAAQQAHRAGLLKEVPIALLRAAQEAHQAGASIFDSRNRRAAGWGRYTAQQLLTAARKKQRNRKASKAARIARRNSRR